MYEPRPQIWSSADQSVTVSSWRQYGALPSAQVVAALMRHGCRLFSVQLNSLINSQSQGPALGPEDQNHRDWACLQSCFFMLTYTNITDAQKCFCFKGKILLFLFGWKYIFFYCLWYYFQLSLKLLLFSLVILAKILIIKTRPRVTEPRLFVWRVYFMISNR